MCWRQGAVEVYYDGSQADNWFHAWPWRWPRDWRAKSQAQSTTVDTGPHREQGRVQLQPGLWRTFRTQTRPIAHSMSRLLADKIASCVLTKVSC